MAEQKSLLSSVIDSVKETIKTTSETVIDYITVPAPDKSDNPIVELTNRESGYEKYYTGDLLLADLDKKASLKTKEEIESLTAPQNLDDLVAKDPLASVLAGILTDAVVRGTSLENNFRVNPSNQVNTETQTETVKPDKSIDVSTINQTPLKINVPIVTHQETNVENNPPIYTKEPVINPQEASSEDEDVKILDTQSQRSIVTKCLEECHKILNRLTEVKERMSRVAYSMASETQFIVFRTNLEDKINKTQDFVDNLVPLQIRLLASNPYPNDKYDVEIAEIQIEELSKEVDHFLEEVKHIQPSYPEGQYPQNINISIHEDPSVIDRTEAHLLEKEQHVLQAENIALSRHEQPVELFESPASVEPKSAEPSTEAQSTETQNPPVEEPKIPYYDERAPYARDLKQKAVELGFEVELTKDFDELIKENQESS